MAFNSSSSSSSSSSFTTSEQSSLLSSPCSSPSCSQAESRVLAVPFSWEHKPGISKPSPISTPPPSSSSSSRKSKPNSTHLLSRQSHEYPPLLPPPPRFSQAFLSQPRCRERKSFTAAPSSSRKKALSHSLSSERPSSKLDDEDDDPFFLAFKACTRENTPNRREKARFDGLQAALRGFFKPSRKDQQGKGSNANGYEDIDDQQTFKGVSSSIARSKLQSLSTQQEKESSKVDGIRSGKDDQGDDRMEMWEATVYKRAKEGNVASKGAALCQVNASAQLRARQGAEPLQGVSSKTSRKATTELSRPAAEGRQEHKRSGEATSWPIKVTEFDSCANAHSSCLAFTDLLGCKLGAVPPALINGSALHPYLNLVPRKLSHPSHHNHN